jgi:acyl-coenzyme A thioesterase PaaI-like protein
MDGRQSFQQEYLDDGECFGCGPRNVAGLRINSYASAEGVMVCDWTPKMEHGNGAAAVCGGILGSVLDCHAAAAVGHALMEREGRYMFAVTKELTVEFLRPTPLVSLRLIARVTDLRARSAGVEATAEANGELCARFRGVFVVPRDAANV